MQTFVLEWNAATVREALIREIRRGGQVYFVHNAVESIEKRGGVWLLIAADGTPILSNSPDPASADGNGKSFARSLIFGQGD